MNQLCFVLMPFRRKTDERGRSIDFDAIYNTMIAPAVADAGLDVIRADEEQVGGTIHKPMFERLQLCEYAIADVTTANPNVYYELGIRHAMKPRSTIIISARGTTLPFDIALLRGIHYEMDEQGALVDAAAGRATIAGRLKAMQADENDDSPVFQFLQGLPRPQVDHEATDLFRERAEYSRTFKGRLADARKQGTQALRAVAAEPALANLNNVEAGIVVDLFLSYRDTEAHADMLALYERMPTPLKRIRMVQEQRGFALNRLGRHAEAADVLNATIQDFGPSSETYGLLGRVYKDLRKAAEAAGDKARARGELKRAVEAYVAGFEADWRDPYPGINALNQMQLLDRPDPREAEIAPVVHYAAMRRVRLPGANYWDYATILEAAVIADNAEAAEAALDDALPRIEVAWWAATTADNMALIRTKRAAKGLETEYIQRIEDELRRTAASLAPPPGAKAG